MPKISVLLPVYNCEKFIVETIESVLQQTYTDFELLIIDDCSTDTTIALIEQFNDSRIQLIKKEINTGYTDSLNYGVSIAKGQYIARMDGDDICLPTRFEKQVAFLDANPKVILCGTAIQIIGTDTILKHPLNHEEIKVKLCFGNSFYHPTVMGRIDVFQSNPYNKAFEPAEDYDLWTRLAFQGKLANLEEVLLLYRVHENQVSVEKNKYQITVGYASQYRMFQFFRLDYDEKVYQIMHKTFKVQDCYTIDDLKNSINFLNSLLKSNATSGIFDKIAFKERVYRIRINFLKIYFKKQKISISMVFLYIKHISIKDVTILAYNKTIK